MQTLRVTAFGVLFTLAYAGFPLSVLTPSNQVVTGLFKDSIILSLPPCSLAAQQASLTYQNMVSKETTTLKDMFPVPDCQSRRDLLSQNGQNIGYQVKNLDSGTQYSFQYTVGSNTSDPLLASTIQEVPYTTIDDGLPARSGAMVVMTVILVLAMALLIVGFVLTVIFAHCTK